MRQKCLESRLKIHSEISKIDFKNLLNDKSATIRNLARYNLRDSNVNFLEHYRKSLLDDRLTESSIYGIGEVGSKSEVDLLLPYLDSQSNRLKKAAIQTILKLDAPRITTELTNELDSEFKSIRKLAIESLSISPRDKTLDKCREIYKYGDIDLKLSMLSFFSRDSSYRTLPDLLQAVNNEDEMISNAAWSHLTDWRRKSVTNYSTPTDIDKQRAKEQYERIKFDNGLSFAKEKLWKEIPYFGRFKDE